VRDILSAGLRGAAGGGLLGAGAGAGLGASVLGQLPVNEILGPVERGEAYSLENIKNHVDKLNPAHVLGLSAAGTLGGTAVGGALHGALLGRNEKSKRKSTDNDDGNDAKEKNAYAFGLQLAARFG
jgi:hypothetical protein